jgi:hypothetical protein
MKLLTHFQWKHLIFTFVMLYALLWLLDPNKAKRVFGGAISVINSLITQLFDPSSSSTSTLRFDPILVTADRQELRVFLTQPNEELLKIRNGFYNQPAGYYIQIDEQGHCRAKTATEFEGRWETPAKILCPQVALILAETKNDSHSIQRPDNCKDPFDCEERDE